MIHEKEERETTFISVHNNAAANNINNSSDSLYNGTFCGKTSSPSSPVRNKVNRKLLAEQSHYTPAKECSSNQYTPVQESSSNHCVSSKETQCKLDSTIDSEKTKVPSPSIASPVEVEISPPCVHYVKNEKSNARTNIKRLKEQIASRREHFFSENKSSSHLCESK